MKSKLFGAAVVVSLMGCSYLAGTATSAVPTTGQTLNQTVDVLKKARALLGSVTTRQGYANIEKAKADVEDAIKETDIAAKANGG